MKRQIQNASYSPTVKRTLKIQQGKKKPNYKKAKHEETVHPKRYTNEK